MMNFIKKDFIFFIFLILTIISIFFVPIDIEYFNYIDFNTLIILYSFMLIVEGMKDSDIFEYISNKILKFSNNLFELSFFLVFLNFFCSMLITNDVSLIVFIPFTIMLLKNLNLEKYIIKLIILETLSANLGSMFTPIGNPQNLYLYIISNMTFLDFIKLMLPYTLISAILLFICINLFFSKKIILDKINLMDVKVVKKYYLILLFVCILSIFKIISFNLLFIIVSIFVLFDNKKLFLKIDYMLLLTFIIFFIFSSNVSRSLFNFINILGNEIFYSIFLSQFISNVPTAILLSKFTNNYDMLIIGTNIGGLGTIIASMASLISYKQLEEKYKKEYLLLFSLFNIIFLFFFCIFIKFNLSL